MASVNDKVTDTRNAARPNATSVTVGRSSGGTTLSCDNLAGWPTASKVHFVTYQIDSSSNPVAGTQLDCRGIVSGNTIGSFVVLDGTDTGNLVGDKVVMLPTASWGQDLADALTAQHTRTGAHQAITTDTITATGLATLSGGTTLPAGDIATADIATNAVTADKLATTAIQLGYAQLTSGNLTTQSTTLIYATGLGVAVTIPTGGRDVKITGYVPNMNIGTVNKTCSLAIFSGASVGTLTTQLNATTGSVPPGGIFYQIMAKHTPAAGALSYSLAYASDPGGAVTTTLSNAATTPAFILVEAI